MTEQPHDDQFLANRLHVLEYLRGVEYPAARADLIDRARKNNADETTRFALEALPERSYASAAEVGDAIGGDLPSSGMQGSFTRGGEPQSAQARPAPVGDPRRKTATMDEGDR